MQGTGQYQIRFRPLLLLLLTATERTICQHTIVTVVDSSLKAAPSWLSSAFSNAESANSMTLKQKLVRVAIDDETDAENSLCQALASDASLLLDLTAGGWAHGRERAQASGVPYVHSQISIYPWMAGVDSLLQSRNATDAALVFSSEALLDQALYYLVEGSVVRVIVLTGITQNTTATLKGLRPSPAYYVLFGSGQELKDMFDLATQNGLVSRDSRWNLAVTSHDANTLTSSLTSTMVTILTPENGICCAARASSTCACTNLNIPERLTLNTVLKTTSALKSSGSGDVTASCSDDGANAPSTSTFYQNLVQEVNNWPYVQWTSSKFQITPHLTLNINAQNASNKVVVGMWSNTIGLQLDANFKNTPVKRFFRVGTVKSRPWMYNITANNDEFEGYCIELTKKLSEMMQFDYEFYFPPDGKYGAKNKTSNTWNGMVGDLARGETDIIVAPLTMTSEREEVIDFVAPYFDQSGISIIIRKREREESLFKFMTVLKPEVWVSIVAALVVTGIMIWFLDRYSPYSAQNSAESYSQPCRKFTLKESFWFALTSFTPQGGGEAPKALSGRVLVAAYWLFVVLMLATFTANLAAFLTVERMQTPVSSLEELAGQSKIKYTVLESSSVKQYFNNMAAAEDELYRVWKELTLNSSSDQSKYRVWDYPIKEQYTHILQVIDETKPLTTADIGIRKVVESQKGEFAFIHDAAELRYEVYHNCHLTEVGEPFAEQPYAIAVQQGSHLQDEISKAILELQKDRYFEALSARFWNSSARGYCPNDDDSEGITLQSLGGVFIATLIGLVLALVALAAEVLYYRKLPSQVSDIPNLKLKPQGEKEQISRINVTPAF